MKKQIIILIALILLSACVHNEEYIINGKVPDGCNEIFITKIINSNTFDTIHKIKPIDGKFTVIGKVDTTSILFLSILGDKGKIPLIIENKNYSIDIYKPQLSDIRNYFIEGGGELQKRRNMMRNKEIYVFKDLDSVIGKYYDSEKKHDVWGKLHYSASLQLMTEMFDKMENEEIEKNNNNLLGVSLVVYRARYLNYERLKSKYDILSDKMKNTVEAIYAKRRITKLGILKLGATAPDFKVNDVYDNEVSLYRTSAKIKVLDFWASWCSPCRVSNNHLVKIYNKFKDEDFVMISISLDTDRKSWINAVNKDKLIWTQVSDLKGSNSPIARRYNIKGIPHIFVLDGNNRIIAEGVNSDELEEIISKHIQK